MTQSSPSSEIIRFDPVALKQMASTVKTARNAREFLHQSETDIRKALASCAGDGTLSAHLTSEGRLHSGGFWEGPGKASLLVDFENAESEEAAQRAFFCHGEVEFAPLGRLLLLDLEFPTRPRPEEHRIDLLAMPVQSPTVRCVIEMKYAVEGAKGDSPVAALLQGLAYAADAQLHHAVLARQHRHEVSRRDIPRLPKGWTPSLLVAANETYWSEWKRVLKEDYPRLKHLAAVVESCSEVSGAHWASFPDLQAVQPTTHPSGRILPRVPCAACRWTDPPGL